MRWLIFVLGAVLSWGAYGSAPSRPDVLGNPLKALLCVGRVFLIGVLVPVGALASQGALSNFNQRDGDGDDRGRAGRHRRGVHHLGVPRGRPARLRDAAGLRRAPIVNVLLSMVIHPPKVAPSPMLYLGFVLASVGAGLVLYYRPAGPERRLGISTQRG